MSCNRRLHTPFKSSLHTFSELPCLTGFWRAKTTQALSQGCHTSASELSQSSAKKDWNSPNPLQSQEDGTCVSTHLSQSCFTHAEVGIQHQHRRWIKPFDFRSSTTTNGTTGICLNQNCGSKSSASVEVSQ